MHVVHVVRQFHPSVGGLEGVVMELARAQMAHGHAVRVVTLNRLFGAAAPGELPAHENLSGLEVVRIPFRGSTRYPIAPSVLKFLGPADIVHVHAIDFFFDFLGWTRPFHGKPIVASTHGGFFHTSFASTLKRVYFRTVTRLSAACYDAIVAVSVADAELFSRISARVVCIENGINLRRFLEAASPTPKKSIVAVGRFSLNKRLDRLIAFFAALRARDPQWTLYLAGRPSDLSAADLASLAERARVREAVQIVESPTDRDLRKIMGQCSVLASSSEYEGFGLTAVEGMAAGLFPLLSDIPAFRHLVTKTGVGLVLDFAKPDDASGQFLQAWQKMPERYGALRKSAIESARPYDWEQVSAGYERLYAEVLAARR